MFDVGEEVICIDTSPGYVIPIPCNLIKGKTYVVLAVEPKAVEVPGHAPFVKVTNNKPTDWYSHKRFRRPLNDKSKLEIINEALV